MSSIKQYTTSTIKDFAALYDALVAAGYTPLWLHDEDIDTDEQYPHKTLAILADGYFVWVTGTARAATPWQDGDPL